MSLGGFLEDLSVGGGVVFLGSEEEEGLVSLTKDGLNVVLVEVNESRN